MKNFKLLNNLIGWAIFLVSLGVYLATLEPSVSLWDCGEFIASGFKLQVGHPPGAPFFLMVARIFSLFADSTANVAKWVNALSAVTSAFTILFLYWTITHLAGRLIAFRSAKEQQQGIQGSDLFVIIASGVVGALAYTFSDTFWFSAVEGEVYAFSSLFTAVVFWAVLKWENESDEPHANRWLILIAYLMGLSIGVHLLNLLAIPAIVFVYYFKKYPVTTPGVFKAILIAGAILGSMMYLLIPGVIWLATRFELLFVNGLGLPYHSGVIAYLTLLAALFAYGIRRSSIRKKHLTNTIFLTLAMILIGYSSYAMIMIRSMANPPMDENNPETIFSLQYYLNREQYGDRPLVYGHYFNARPEGLKEGKSVYNQVDGKYKVTNRRLAYRYDPEFNTLFPRMYSSDNEHINVYLEWTGLKESRLYEPMRDGSGNALRDENGNIRYNRSAPKRAPGFAANLKFFFAYQLGHMYFRYFMWNFAGRQNDLQGHGDPLSGNWISGIKPVDSLLIGNQSDLPIEEKEAPSRNTYYFLPFLLGLVGLAFQFQRDTKNFWVVMLLFVMTGIAIVVYLNQTPIQPRERDYAYAGSFYAFAIWIGLGVLALADSIAKKYRNTLTIAFTSFVCALAVPGVMAAKNWDDHDRSGRFSARDIAYNYLQTCAPNAILFTNGDNDTFPLWYAQEVEGIRTDVRIVNLMLLNMDWYIDQMRMKSYHSEPLPFSLAPDEYRNGIRDLVFVQERTEQSAALSDILDFVRSDLPQAKVEATTGEKFNFIPTRNFSLEVDRKRVIENGTVDPADSLLVVSKINWRFGRNSLGKSELVVLDILAHNNWHRPIYFASLGHTGTLGLEEYTQLEGFAYRLVPIKTPTPSRYESGRVAIDRLYENLIEKFSWRGIPDSGVYLDEFHIRTLAIVRARNRYIQLAEALINKGEMDKAASVLNRCLDILPPDIIPFDHAGIQIASGFYRCNLHEKANEVVERLADQCDRKLIYYLSQKQSFQNSIADQIIYTLQIMQNLSSIARSYNETELGNSIADRASVHLNRYSPVQ